MTVVEFLEARLAEDELTAHAATDASLDWRPYDYCDVKDLEGHFVVQADSRHRQPRRPRTSRGTARPACCGM